jgi:hypothetical protein
LDVEQHFRGTCHFCCEDQKVRQAQTQHKAGSMQTSACYLFHAGLVLGIFFNPEDEGDAFLKNIE